jgi:alpha-tubulin suppressor-like RCC1 family protein
MIPGLLPAAELRVDSIATPPDRSEVRFAGEPGFYYVLWRGDSVTDIRLATDLALNGGTQSLLTDTNANSATQQFYRVEKVPVTSLRDTDGDGLSDVWELQHRHRGAALDGADAEEDHDANGVPDRMDALRASLREGAVGGRPVLAAGTYHTLAIKADGTLWGWGNNKGGELGIGGVTDTNVPIYIHSDTNWVAVSASFIMSYGLKADGSLWAWGQPGSPGSFITPIQIGPGMKWLGLPKDRFADNPVAVREDGTRWQISGSATNLQQLGSDNDWAAVVDGDFSQHWAIKGDGTLWNGLSIFDTNPVWNAISVGSHHALALQTNGTLWAWISACCGLIALNGELGIGSLAQPTIPTQVGTNRWAAVAAGDLHSIGIQSDGSLWWWGANFGFQAFSPGTTLFQGANVPTRFGTNVDWLAVTAGNSHSAALRADGTIWTFGFNELGKLGNGTLGVLSEPVQVGVEHDWATIAAGTRFSFGIKSNGTLWSWGANDFGVLGLGDLVGSAIPRQVPGTNWTAVSGGNDHVAALRDDGSLWVWGKYFRSLNMAEELFTNQPTQLGTNTDWVTVSAGLRHALGIRQDTTLWTWGRGGMLGAIQNAPVLVQTPGYGDLGWLNVAAGHEGSLGVRQFSLWTWGNRIGSFSGSSTPDPIGDVANWAAVANAKYHLTRSHALALRRDGTLWSWGGNFRGQLGTNVEALVPARVGAGTNWSAIAVGDMFSAALQTDGSLHTTGFDWYGQLGLGTRTDTNRFTRVGTETNWAAISAGNRHVLGLKTDGSIWAWGDNSYGQCAQPAFFEPSPVPGTNWGRLR